MALLDPDPYRTGIFYRYLITICYSYNFIQLLVNIFILFEEVFSLTKEICGKKGNFETPAFGSRSSWIHTVYHIVLALLDPDPSIVKVLDPDPYIVNVLDPDPSAEYTDPH